MDCLSAKAATGGNPVIRTRKRLRIGYNLESFSTKSTLSGGLNRIHDEIPLAWDEIRLDGGWVDLISSEAVGEDFIQTRLDFILQSRISLLIQGLRLDFSEIVWYNLTKDL